jgi:hypothetical protein
LHARDLIVTEALREHTFRTLRDGVTAYSPQHQRIAVVGAQDDFCCVLSTRIAIDILKEHGIGARAMKVHVRAYNRALWEWEQNPVGPIPEDKGLLRCCGDGTGEMQNEGWLNGHCIAIVEKEILLDTSAPQFTTITPGGARLFVPPLMLRIDPDWLKAPSDSWMTYELDEELNGGAILYRQPEDLSGMFDSSDWNLNTSDGEAARILTTAVKEKVRENVQRALRLAEAMS